MALALQTTVPIEESPLLLKHNRKVMLIGSCFTEHIGGMLADSGFEVLQNPSGILYNPLSIATCIERCMKSESMLEEELVFNNGLWHSWLHHGSFSKADKSKCIEQCESEWIKAHDFLTTSPVLIITLGAAQYYTLCDTDFVVANCHKVPSSQFKLHVATPHQIVDRYKVLLESLQTYNVQVLFTLSPIRHWSYGPHGNQIGKASCLLAIEQLISLFPQQCFYFPAYEIMMDELRDYRYYADDMLHPSSLAQRIIWDRFVSAHMNQSTRELTLQFQKLHKMEAHRPINPDSTEQQRLEQRIAQLRNQLKAASQNSSECR